MNHNDKKQKDKNRIDLFIVNKWFANSFTIFLFYFGDAFFVCLPHVEHQQFICCLFFLNPCSKMKPNWHTKCRSNKISAQSCEYLLDLDNVLLLL